MESSVAIVADVDGRGAPKWLLSPTEVVRLLAAGILDWRELVESSKPVRMPYPENLQAALNGLTLLAWHQGTSPPASVTDLLGWAGQPFEDWPVDVMADGEVEPDECLVSGFGRPTDVCEELGCFRGDVVAELRETELIQSVMAKARRNEAPESYVAYRRLLIERVTLTRRDLDLRLADPELSLLAAEVREAYDDAPPEAKANGVVRVCGGCDGIMLPGEDGRDWVCEDRWCPKPGVAATELAVSEEVRCLRRDLRAFVAGPGRAELRLARAVENLGVTVSLWPDFDAADLAVFDERRWVADVKAWSSPIRLANSLLKGSFSPPAYAERAFIVAAEEQAKQRRYIERVRNECGETLRSRGIEVMSEGEFRRAVADRVRSER